MAQNWSYIGAGAVVLGLNAVVPVPAGYAAGDLLVICSNGALPSTPTGWTAISSGAYAYACYKFAGASESSVTLAGGSTTGLSVMLCYRQILSADTSAASASGTSTTVSTNTQTTTATDDLVISIFGCSNTSATITAPGSTTTRINEASSTYSTGMLIVDEDKAASGATTARTATFSSTVGSGCISFSFKQKPKVGSMLLMF